MADANVTERRIRPIQDAIAAGNWKQALKDCEKWQKKGENSDRFLALKAAVLMHQPDAKTREKGQSDTLQLCRRKEPVLNLEAIYQLQDSLRQLSLETEEGPKLWERAIAARPTDKDLLTTWLNNSITTSSWRSAQKATTALKKAFPKERHYEFWNILMCYLIHQDETLPENERKLFGTLANRMITKAAQSIPSDKAVSTPEELSLLAEVLMNTGSISELIQLLQNQQLSPVTNLDQPHTDTLLMRAVRNTNDEIGIGKKFVENLVANQVDHGISEDDRLWNIFAESANTLENQKQCVKQLDQILEKSPKHRQALLCKIDILARIAKQDPTATETLLKVCTEYHHLFVTKAFCFDDLIVRLAKAWDGIVPRFQQILSADTTNDSSQQIFNLKLQYGLLFTEGSTPMDALTLSADALDLYLETQEQTQCYPEAALLAALGLLRAGFKTGSKASVLQANMVLQTASAKFKDYYPLRVLLTQVQMFSAQVHLAMDTFFQLSIKNLQWETLGYLLLTRISTLHPYQHGHGEESLNPLGALDLALEVSDNSQRSLDRAIREGLKNESYSNVTDTVQLRTNLQRSFVRQLFTIEERKCRRVLGVPVRPGLETFHTKPVDLRDLSFMPTYGVDGNQMRDLLSCGPRPGQGWVNMMRLQEYLLAYLSAELVSTDAGLVAYTYSKVGEARIAVSNDIPTDLTGPERENGLCIMILSGIVLGLSPKVSDMEESIGKVMTLVQSSKSAKELQAVEVNGVECPDWQYLHCQFVRLETLRAVANWATVMTKKLKGEKDKGKQAQTAGVRTQVNDLRPAIETQLKAIHSQTRALKDKLSASGVLGNLVDAVMGRTDDASEVQKRLSSSIQRLQDEAAVEEYCGSLRESWEDALDGILATKIKVM